MVFVVWRVIFITGRTESAERYAYGIVSIAITIGNLLSRYPRCGYMVVAFFSLSAGYLFYAFFSTNLGGLDNINHLLD